MRRSINTDYLQGKSRQYKVIKMYQEKNVNFLTRFHIKLHGSSLIFSSVWRWRKIPSCAHNNAYFFGPPSSGFAEDIGCDYYHC